MEETKSQFPGAFASPTQKIPELPEASGVTVTQMGDAVEVTWNVVNNEDSLTVTVDRYNIDANIVEVLWVQYGYMPPFYDWVAVPGTHYQYYIIFSNSNGSIVGRLSSGVILMNLTSDPVLNLPDFNRLDPERLTKLIETLKVIQANRVGDGAKQVLPPIVPLPVEGQELK